MTLDLKATSDDALPNYLNSLKFKQSHFYTDVRLALGYISVIIAGALFYFDWKLGWDVTKPYTLPAVVAYGLLNAGFTYWVMFVEKGQVYVGERNGVKLVISTTTKVTDGKPIYQVKAKFTTPQKQWKKVEIEASLNRWFSSDGFFVARPFQQFLAGGIPVIGEADPKNAVEEIVRSEKPTAVPVGSQNFDVNIGNLSDVLQHIGAQGTAGAKATRRKA